MTKAIESLCLKKKQKNADHSIDFINFLVKIVKKDNRPLVEDKVVNNSQHGFIQCGLYITSLVPLLYQARGETVIFIFI